VLDDNGRAPLLMAGSSNLAATFISTSNNRYASVEVGDIGLACKAMAALTFSAQTLPPVGEEAAFMFSGDPTDAIANAEQPIRLSIMIYDGPNADDSAQWPVAFSAESGTVELLTANEPIEDAVYPMWTHSAKFDAVFVKVTPDGQLDHDVQTRLTGHLVFVSQEQY